jgi:ABC-2 type transport system ATP-binding protein
MDEAQHLAHRVAIIVAGRLVAQGAPSSLAGRQGAATTVRFRLPRDAPALPDELAAAAIQRDDETIVRIPDPVPALHTLTGWALAKGVEIRALSVAQPTLEDIYLELTSSAGEAL